MRPYTGTHVWIYLLAQIWLPVFMLGLVAFILWRFA